MTFTYSHPRTPGRRGRQRDAEQPNLFTRGPTKNGISGLQEKDRGRRDKTQRARRETARTSKTPPGHWHRSGSMRTSHQYIYIITVIIVTTVTVLLYVYTQFVTFMATPNFPHIIILQYNSLMGRLYWYIL